MILSIDTSTTVCSVALHSIEGPLLAFYELHIDKSHAEYLNTMVQNLLDNAGLEMKDLKAIALSGGPGSYTGLRIGTAAAKGYSYTLDIPMISISTLKAMAHAMHTFVPDQALLMPMIDARRMEVFTATFNSGLELVDEVKPLVVDEQAFQDTLENSPVYFFGNGAMKCQEVIQHEQAFFIPGIVPSAKDVGALAIDQFKKEVFEDTAYFEPFYLKEFQTKPSTKKWL